MHPIQIQAEIRPVPVGSYNQARSQIENEVHAKYGRGSGGRLEAPSGSRAKPWWGPRGRSPRKLLGFTNKIT